MSSGMTLVRDGQWEKVRRNFARIGSTVLGPHAEPTFAGITLTGLTAERLIWANSAKALASKDLVDLVAGTANEINITDDGSGGIVIGIVDPLIVAKGGIGTASLTDHGLLVGSGTAAVTALGVAANGKIPIGSVGADPVLAEITGTANQIVSTPGAGSITLSTPQNIHTAASNFTVAGATIDGIVFGGVYDVQEEPTGFVDRTATLSWNDGTQTLTITGNHDIYIYGVKTTKSTDSIQITNATDLYWIYYNASGTLVASTTHPGWALPIMATVYWNTTVGFDKGLAGDERHGLVMDWATHEYLHNTVGSRYESGLAGTFDNTTLSIATGGWHDEDIEHTLASPETTCNVLYKNGSAAWEWDAGTSVYYKLNGTALRYNNGNNLADCTPNRYMAMWIFATNDISTPIVALMGQRQDTTLKDARANNTYDTLSFGELPFWEMKILYRVILRSTGSPPTYTETLDLRAVSNLPAGTYIATDHATLTGLTVGNPHTQYLLVDGTTALAGAWDMGSQALTNVNIDSGVITGITDLAIADGGTGASSASNARTNFGLGTGDSPTFSSITASNDFFASSGVTGAPSFSFTGDTNTGMWSSGGNRINFSVAGTEKVEINATAILFADDLGMGNNTITNCSSLTINTSIELGHVSDTTITRASAGNLNIEGKLVYRTDGTDVPIADGGSGQSTAQNAINALSAVSGAANEHILTKDTGTGNAVFKAPVAHTHDGDELQLNSIDSNGGQFDFQTTGKVKFTNEILLDSSNVLLTHRAGVVLAIQGETAGSSTGLEFYTKDGDGTDHCIMAAFGFGAPADAYVNVHVMQFGWNKTLGYYRVLSFSSGAQTPKDIAFTTTNFAHQVYLKASNGYTGFNDNAPGEMVDVAGNINVTGVYKVDDVQVVGNRVIDARCNDAINSGDATTDGVIDSLRDAMITHGLIAAS